MSNEQNKYDQAAIDGLRYAAAEDLRLLALLHGGELTAEMANELRDSDFQERLGLVLESELATEAMLVINQGIGELKDERTLDQAAADYTDIYLTHRLQLSPLESPWLDEDGLVNGDSMFMVREWYTHYGLEAEDWRLRADDHISLQLTFIAHLLALEEPHLEAAGRFMDEHILRWLGGFGEGVAQRAATPFYAGLAMLTFAYLEELRGHIMAITGEPRKLFEEDESDGDDDDAMPFAPGAGPSW